MVQGENYSKKMYPLMVDILVVEDMHHEIIGHGVENYSLSPNYCVPKLMV